MREIRYDEDEFLDDVAIDGVEMFRLERMGKHQWWMCLRLEDQREIHFWMKNSRKDGMVISITDNSAQDVVKEVRP